jgi:molybdopterin-guanine dinucleotide biosynthesis protein A
MPSSAAIILCGGESSRMGRPKAWLDFGPEKLLQRVVRLSSTVADPVVVVAAPGQDLPALPPAVRIVHDAVSGRGPLQGLLAGLNTLPDESTFAYVASTDAPFLNPAWIALLSQLIGDDDLAIPDVDDRYHPLAALYRVGAIRPVVERLLASDQLRLLDLVGAVKTRVVRAEELAAVDPGCRTLQNLNTAEDYRNALNG